MAAHTKIHEVQERKKSRPTSGDKETESRRTKHEIEIRYGDQVKQYKDTAAESKRHQVETYLPSGDI